MFGYKVNSRTSDKEGFIASNHVNFVDGDAEVIVVWKDSIDVTVEKLSNLALEPIPDEEEQVMGSVLSLVPDDDPIH